MSVLYTAFESRRRVKRYGWRPDTPDHRDLIRAPHHSVLGLPSKGDVLSVLQDPYDQEEWGSCISNACGLAEMAIEKKEGNPTFMPARFFIYWNIRRIEGTGSDNDCGGQVRDGIKALNSCGVPPEDMWPYEADNFSKQPSHQAYAEAAKHKLLKYERVLIDPMNVKSVIINEGLPVVFGMPVYDYFETPEMAASGLLHMPSLTEAPVGGHCITIAGYDDHRTFDDPAAGVGGLLIQNSWGKDWGLGGRFWMPYRYFQLCQDAWAMQRAA